MGVFMLLPMVLPTLVKIIGLIPFENFEKTLPINMPGHVNIEILVGLDGAGPHLPTDKNPLSEAGGHIPRFQAWDTVGNPIGWWSGYDHNRIESGTFKTVHFDVKARQPAYLRIAGKENAICLAMLKLAWGPNRQGFVWTGDWAEICNKDWYYSNVFMEAHPLKCTWLDENGNQKQKAISLYIPDFFTDDNKKTPDKDLFCKDTPTQRFITSWGRRGKYPAGILRWTRGSRAKTIKEQKATTNAKDKKPKVKRSQTVHRMVKSSIKQHSARELCESPNSVGPDLVSFEEGTFCDMDTRQVYDLCAKEDSVDCFDVETRKIRASEAGIKKRGEPVYKEYSQVLEW